jgi:tRNA-specific 2-thiouridylase
MKVAVGMSGGVDSSVSALLLKQQGYDVVGFFMKLWHDPCGTSENACCDERALMDARKVADQLEIPFYVVDAREEFKAEIVDYFIDEYKNLRTPNPCVLCNKKIKFGWLLQFAEKVGCEKLATGHYARIEKSSKYHLLRGADEAKDQTYFLHQLDQEQLSHIIFPVGEMTKTEVRALAKEYNLPTLEKKESQEVCFVAENDYREFLKRYLDSSYFQSGKIVDQAGFTIGEHNGLISYTIGQRKGINQNNVFDNGRPKTALYVTGFDKSKNQLIVGKDEELLENEMIVSGINWISAEAQTKALNTGKEEIKAKIRYGAKGAICEIIEEVQGGKSKVKFTDHQRAITPGQSAVFYCEDEVLGGGIIN